MPPSIRLPYVGASGDTRCVGASGTLLLVGTSARNLPFRASGHMLLGGASASIFPFGVKKSTVPSLFTDTFTRPS